MEANLNLILFVLFTGMAVGAALIAGFADLYDGFSRKERFSQVSRWGAYIAFPAIVLGMLSSLFHLSVPGRFLQGLTNYSSSWISREGLAGIVFAVLAFVYAAIWFLAGRGSFKIGSTVRRVIAALMIAVAAVLIYAQASIYSFVRPIPAWNSALTLAFFVASALALGALAVATALAIGYLAAKDVPAKESYRLGMLPFPAISIFAVAAVSLVSILWLLNMGMVPENVGIQQAREVVVSSSLGLTILAVLAGMLVPLVLLAFARTRVCVKPKQGATLLIASFVFVLIGTIVERALFMLSAIHVSAF